MNRIDPTRYFRPPLLALAMGSLVLGLWGGLVRIGAGLPLVSPAVPGMHGPIMVGGFLGTLIALERAVAIGKRWAYLAPLAAGAGGVLALMWDTSPAGPLLLVASSAILCFMFVPMYRMQPAGFLLVMGLGVVAWLVGNLMWTSGRPLHEVVWWWMMFLVLTIAGERLELSRILMHRPGVLRPFFAMVLLVWVGLALLFVSLDTGVRVVGVALVALGIWMILFDIARFTIRTHGLTRYIAACLLSGYLWLIAGGVLAVGYGHLAAGPIYDALLHAVFVGFVFSMIFGHAPIIFPSVLGIPVGYTPWLYVFLGALHAGLSLRIVADLMFWMPGRTWGSILSAIAILFFLLTMAGTLVCAVVEGRREQTMTV